MTEKNNIPAFWESIFCRRHIKEAKQVFQDLGIVTLVNPIPGFKSAGYKINLCDELCNGEATFNRDKITSIRTLEKLNRIKKVQGEFYFK
jgi:hypothetical protein